MGTEWSFTASITHPDGTDVHVSFTIPVSAAEAFPSPQGAMAAGVLECSELAQIGAARSMSAYVATLAQLDRVAREEVDEQNRRIMATLNPAPF